VPALISINDTFTQPSQRAQFSAGECNIIGQQILDEKQCAQYVATESDAGLTT
jgi:hypothetical protein